MNIQNVILGFLSEEPMSGYDIKRKMEVTVAHFFDASFGAIYPALRRMEKDGYVKKEVIQQEGKPNKNLYVITSKGQEEFQQYMESPINPTIMRSDFFIRLFFGKFTKKENILQWMENEKEHVKRDLESLLEVQSNSSNTDKYKKITLEYGLEYSKMTIKLLDTQIKFLREEYKGKF
ncbi:PadR family transcriptional regulator [Peribacillus simplex]|uniref:PadR family transcriptional regulator n=1 Tax=Peribacillus simplex TaxID=1478 RepID=UPI00298E9E39|nr:PadR family transcriptional regulator [Peribacillus simplex]MDW7618012.1 PadR family transcriptional regulator [Peribacillus simplex]